MKKQFATILLIGIMAFTSLGVFGNASGNSNNYGENNAFAMSFANLNLNMEYCSVDLADRRSSLNVRTWEGRIVGKLKHGTTVWVNEYSGEWARVSVKRGRRWVSIGWVSSNYLLC
jgi:hypothetical protein